jgi:hypothetical protein
MNGYTLMSLETTHKESTGYKMNMFNENLSKLWTMMLII